MKSSIARIALLVSLLVLGVNHAQAALTTVTGYIYRADGSPATGLVTIQWQQFTNSSGNVIPAGSLVVNIPSASAGLLTVSLEPNTSAAPSGTSYKVQYRLDGAQPFLRYWYVPISNSPVTIGTVEFPPIGLVGATAAVNPTQILQNGANLNDVLTWNGSYWQPKPGGGGGGSPLFSSILTGVNNSGQTMTVGSTSVLTYSGTGILNANQILGNAISGLKGNSGQLLQASGTFTSGNLIGSDASGNAIDSGVVPSTLVLNTGSYPNPSWLTLLAASKLTGYLACAQMPGLTGDVTNSPGSCATSVSSTNGVAFVASATTDTTNAANISSGVLNPLRVPAINLAGSGPGGVTGNLQIVNFNGGTGASSTTAWFGDGTWKSIAAGGTVTNSSGPLSAGNLMIGNGANDLKALGSLGTTTTLLHGNSGGNPSFGPVVLTTDVSGILGTANGGLGSQYIVFSGPSGSAKTFTLPNAPAAILTSNSAVTLAQGGTGTDLSAILKGGIVTGTGSGTVGITTVGADGQVLSADSTQAGGVKWITVGTGSGTVTSIATTGPLSGGTITTTGTLSCPTCTTNAAAATANQLMIGGGSQAIAALGTLGTVHTLLHGNNAGAPGYSAVDLTADVINQLPQANGGLGAAAPSAQIQYLRSKPNAGNNTTFEFAALPAINAADYNFPAQAPGGSISVGSNTITLSPVPLGVNGTDAGHYVYLSGGTGTAEAVLITGGSATSGSSSGTITFTAANTHSGAWTVASATAGIQEAINVAGQSGAVYMPAGSYNLYAAITDAVDVSISGAGSRSTILVPRSTTMDVFHITGGSTKVSSFRGFSVIPASTATAGSVFVENNHYFGTFDDLYMEGIYNGFTVQTAVVPNYSNLTLRSVVNSAWIFSDSYQHEFSMSNINVNSGGTTNDLIVLAGTIAGANMVNVNLQGGSHCIRVSNTSGSVNELLLSNLTFDSYSGTGLLADGSAGGQGWTISGVRTAGLSAASSGAISIHGGTTPYTHIVVQGLTGSSNGNAQFAFDLYNTSYITIQGVDWSGQSYANSIILNLNNTSGTVSHLTASGLKGSGLNYGVVLNSAAHSYIEISNSDLSGNSGGAFVNNATGSGPIMLKGVIFGTSFSSLPAAASALRGSTADITDSTTNTWGATITGAGTYAVLAYCDGTNWTVAAK